MIGTRSVVYFAFLGEEGTPHALVRQRLAFLERQLGWLAALIADADMPVNGLMPYVAPMAWDGAVHAAAARHGFRIDPASVTAERRNTFEYPGFRALKALAGQSAPDALLYYCHSKGIVQLAEGKMGLFRLHTHVGLTTDLTDLNRTDGLTRAGLFPSRPGWCWYNFFWIKAGFMAGRPVEEHEDRYQFEALIGDRSDKEGYRGVLPLIERVAPPARAGIALQPWYRPVETASPALFETYDRYAQMDTPAQAAGMIERPLS